MGRSLLILILLAPLWARGPSAGSSFLQEGMTYECLVTGEYRFNSPSLYTNRQILAREMVPLKRFDAVRLILGDETYKYLRSENKGGKQIDIYGSQKRWIQIDSIRFKAGRVFWFTLYFRNKKRSTKVVTCLGYPNTNQ